MHTNECPPQKESENEATFSFAEKLDDKIVGTEILGGDEKVFNLTDGSMDIIGAESVESGTYLPNVVVSDGEEMAADGAVWQNFGASATKQSPKKTDNRGISEKAAESGFEVVKSESLEDDPESVIPGDSVFGFDIEEVLEPFVATEATAGIESSTERTDNLRELALSNPKVQKVFGKINKQLSKAGLFELENDPKNEPDETKEPRLLRAESLAAEMKLAKRLIKLEKNKEKFIKKSVTSNGSALGIGYKNAKRAYEMSLSKYLDEARKNPQDYEQLIGVEFGLDSGDQAERDAAFYTLTVATLAEQKADIEQQRTEMIADRIGSRRAKVVQRFQAMGKGKKIVAGIAAGAVAGSAAGALLGGGAAVAVVGGTVRVARNLANNFRGYQHSNERVVVHPDDIPKFQKAASSTLAENTSHRKFYQKDAIQNFLTDNIDAELLEARKGNREALKKTAIAVGLGAVAGEFLGAVDQKTGMFGKGAELLGEAYEGAANFDAGETYNGISGLAGDIKDSAGGTKEGISEWLDENSLTKGNTYQENSSVEVGNDNSDLTAAEGELNTDFRLELPEEETQNEGFRLELPEDFDASEYTNRSPESVEVAEGAFTGIIGAGEGATHLMSDMFQDKISPEDLHQMYLTAVEEKGSEGVAGLFENAYALDEASDQWGTVTGFEPGENAITADGVQYFTELAEKEGFIDVSTTESGAGTVADETLRDTGEGGEAYNRDVDTSGGAEIDGDAAGSSVEAETEAILDTIDTSANPSTVAETLAGADKNTLVQNTLDQLNKEAGAADISFDKNNGKFTYAESGRVITKTDVQRINVKMIELVRAAS